MGAKQVKQINFPQVGIASREQLIAEYMKMSKERSELESKARKLKAESDKLKAMILPHVKSQPEMKETVGRFMLEVSERSRENVNIKDARASMSPAALAELEKLVTVSQWDELDVDLIDVVGDLIDLVEEGN
jgi:hypothetical protein